MHLVDVACFHQRSQADAPILALFLDGLYKPLRRHGCSHLLGRAP